MPSRPSQLMIKALSGLALFAVTACASMTGDTLRASPAAWPVLDPPPRDPEIEARIGEIMAKMTLEQKVGQVIQADSDSVTPDEVRKYRLGSVLSGGNSAPGDAPYADAAAWLEAADAYFDASVDDTGVDIAIPVIWGIDAVHGHANLTGATVFPHNIGLGAANDPGLIEKIMEVTATELIVSGHDWTFAPTLAVPRDIRWGRTYEGFSEDPAIVASYGDRIVQGLQGRPGTDTYFDATRVISTAKHFVGDGATTNGIDQGDAAISETKLRDIHAAGYFPAIEAGAGSVMASFNSWNGEKMHGRRDMLTDVLKTRMGFDGFVVGDWNGHGQIPGCTNTDCPKALNAGIDMYMAPDSWKGIHESTLAAVRSGEIAMARLDDAVARILRVKLAAGVFEKPRPSARPMAGDTSLLGSPAHRAVAREAVRKSLVLLKNEDGLLPLDPTMTILVVGDGADSISKQAGGWTLSWQGGGYANSDFPNGQSILDGLRQAVRAKGGQVIFDPEGTADVEADVVIAVYGEDPYAEFQGDLDHLDFQPNGFDTTRLDAYEDRGIPVVSVFLSGRPLWVNPEINASDAFIAAWLPGTEGGGVADLILRTDPAFDFTGRLSFAWPATAVASSRNGGGAGRDILFPLGYGLSFGDGGAVGDLPEDSGLSDAQLSGDASVFVRGTSYAPWKAFLISRDEAVLLNGTGANLEGLTARRTDHLGQEDAFLLDFSAPGHALAFLPEGADVDWSDALAQGKALGFAAKTRTAAKVALGVGCGPEACEKLQTIQLEPGDWREVSVPLSCFGDVEGLLKIEQSISFSASPGTQVAFGNIRLVSPAGDKQSCEN